ncbi:hypothetical protein TNCV_2179911 [Trichonephila clavipes]|uniref:Uncharacterized protein n=1 Tax=Trichonephila clavipes TaxID=2585209 RepID=A0A8X6VUM4_TRICX|nr:hypothetical protein TNCV_2179911 [Trichonephila clavipes]
MEVKTQFGSVMRPIQKLYPLEVTTVDSLPLTERDVEDGPCLDQRAVQIFFYRTFILAVLAAVLDSSTTSNPKGGRMSQTSNQATPNQKAPTAPPLEGTDIIEYIIGTWMKRPERQIKPSRERLRNYVIS